MYDCETDTWHSKSPMNIPRAFHSATVLNNKIYIIGGRENPEEISVKTRDSLAIYTIEEYDPENDKWIVKTTMPFKHFTIGAVTIKDKIYILSDTADNRMLDKVSVLEEYDPVNNQFKSLASLPRSRCDAAMVCINDKIVVLGGWYNDALSFVDEYDPKSGCWTKKPDLLYPVQNHQAASYKDGILITGGIIYSNEGSQKKNGVMLYEINKNCHLREFCF
jgi:N-acetylneuraminic acid mutarotase